MDYKETESLKQLEKVQEILAGLPYYAGKYFTHMQDKNRSTQTMLQYAYDLKKFFAWLQDSPAFRGKNIRTMTADETIGKLSVEDFQEYFDTYRSYEDKEGNTKYYDAGFRARKMISLRSFCRYLFKIGDLPADLSSIIDIPQTKEKEIVPLYREDVSLLLSSVEDTEGLSGRALKNKKITISRDRAILTLLFGTGIRVSELVGIDMQHIDFYKASIIVTRKGGNQDLVFFGPEVENALKDYIENGRPALLAEKKDDALFISLQHKRMSVRNVEMLTKSYGEKTGLSDLGRKTNPHAFRKTYGTALYEETGDIYLVAAALNHSSVETTKKHYAKMSEERKRLAAQKSSALFEK